MTTFGAINDALEVQPPATQAAIRSAFSIAGGFGYPWRTRYAAAEKALAALGAQPRGRRRSKLWYFPCGCVYELHYAEPLPVRNCALHPISPVKLRDVLSVARGCLFSLLFVAASWAVIYLVIAIFD